MSVPTFNGVACFGSSPVLVQHDLPRERQLNGFFGLDGLESLDGGDRGLETHASGILLGTGESGLRSMIQAFRALKDGQPHTLIDTLGATWDDVLLNVFNPSPIVHATPIGQRWCHYEAQFLHLTSDSS